MEFRFVEYIDEYEDNRVEISFVNFDFEDGNDLIARILKKKCCMIVGKKFDGIWFSIIPLWYKGHKYELLFHEDIGNIIYGKSQKGKSVERMRELAEIATRELNILYKENNGCENDKNREFLKV